MPPNSEIVRTRPGYPTYTPGNLTQHLPSRRMSTQSNRDLASLAGESSTATFYSSSAESARQTKIKKHPCPYAASHSCTATFTTSGHAARHGRKHTGKESVHCPVCNKAFTRKDNMKQHRRTHRSHPEDDATPRERDPKWSLGDRRADNQLDSDTEVFSSGRSHGSPGAEGRFLTLPPAPPREIADFGLYGRWRV
jgi:uncharacterized Zn-finger protein